MVQNASTSQRVRLQVDEPETPRDTVTVPIRWIVSRIEGGKANAIHSISSYGEPRCLIDEVNGLCAAFHPTGSLHAFPRKTPVLLFWQAQSTGDWIVIRVTLAPGTVGDEESLEYFCLVFDDCTFQALRYNPFRTQSLNLHDRLRTHLMEQHVDALRYFVQRSAVPTSRRVAKNPNGAAEAQSIPGIDANRIATATTFRAVQEYCGRWSEAPAPPPTFATWWANEGSDFERYFDLVLRAPQTDAPTLHEVQEAFAALTSELKSALPGPAFDDVITMTEIQYVLRSATAAEHEIARAVAFGDVARPYDMQTHITEARLNLSLLSSRIESLVSRLDTRLTDDEIFRLRRVAEQSLDIAHSLLAICSNAKAVRVAAAGPLSVLRATWLNRRRSAENRSGRVGGAIQV
jgi:hypothetical protein